MDPSSSRSAPSDPNAYRFANFRNAVGNTTQPDIVTDYIFSWYDTKMAKLKAANSWRYLLGLVNLLIYALLLVMLFLDSNPMVSKLLASFRLNNLIPVPVLLLLLMIMGHTLSLLNDSLGLLGVGVAGLAALFKSGVFGSNQKKNWFILAFGIGALSYAFVKFADQSSMFNFAEYPMLVNIFKYTSTISIVLAMLALTGYSSISIGKGSGLKDNSLFYN